MPTNKLRLKVRNWFLAKEGMRLWPALLEQVKKLVGLEMEQLMCGAELVL